MAPREIEILTMTKLERDGHQSTPAENGKSNIPLMSVQSGVTGPA